MKSLSFYQLIYAKELYSTPSSYVTNFIVMREQYFWIIDQTSKKIHIILSVHESVTQENRLFRNFVMIRIHTHVVMYYILALEFRKTFIVLLFAGLWNGELKLINRKKILAF